MSKKPFTEQEQQEEYNNAPIIPLNTSSYNKVILIMYKKIMLKPKYFLLFILFASPIYFFASYFVPNELALLVTTSIFTFVLLIFPPAFSMFN